MERKPSTQSNPEAFARWAAEYIPSTIPLGMSVAVGLCREADRVDWPWLYAGINHEFYGDPDRPTLGVYIDDNDLSVEIETGAGCAAPVEWFAQRRSTGACAGGDADNGLDAVRSALDAAGGL